MARLTATLVAGIAVGAGTQAHAAQYFWEPNVEAFAEAYTNRDLVPDAFKESTQSYGANLTGLLGIATPRSTTSIQPTVRFQNFPDRPDAEDLEGGVEFATAYRTQRSSFGVTGNVNRQDVYNAELADPRFSELNPNDPTAPTTGRIQGIGETRDTIIVRPRFTHAFTERFEAGLQGSYENYKYSSDIATSLNDYDFAQLGVYPTWTLSQRTRLNSGVYVTEYNLADDSSSSSSVGAQLGVTRELTQTFTMDFAVVVERTDIDRVAPVRSSEKKTSAGGRFSLARRSQVSEMRLDLSHLVSPTGAGGLYETDLAQVQYDRRLSPRLTVRSAIIYYKTSALSTFDIGGDQDYLNGELGLRWNVTPTWYVSGGYRYVWQEDQLAPESVKNHTAFVGVGYKALSRRQQ